VAARLTTCRVPLPSTLAIGTRGPPSLCDGAHDLKGEFLFVFSQGVVGTQVFAIRVIHMRKWIEFQSAKAVGNSVTGSLRIGFRRVVALNKREICTELDFVSVNSLQKFVHGHSKHLPFQVAQRNINSTDG
jgi:hypothetical protein